MSKPKVSVIIPTHNRPEKLERLLACLIEQNVARADYEIIVIDDNSCPPVVLPESAQGSQLALMRLEGTERSAGRNTGATLANGNLLIFVDDDITVEKDFLSCHLRAHDEWPGALVVGSVRLPGTAKTSPFVRFRQSLEDQSLPERGPTDMPNFCTAANMSISRETFRNLGGFDKAISSSEDQDFALRHTARGGRIVFLPEAKAIHWDSSLDIRSYCGRVEWGSRNLIPFCKRYPEWPDNVERQRVNGKLHVGREPAATSLRKMTKSTLSLRLVREVLFGIASTLERVAPNGLLLDRVYRLLIGIHLLRGYRQGLTHHDGALNAQNPVPKIEGLDRPAKASN
jgi:GT2 family glycosyltransferase